MAPNETRATQKEELIMLTDSLLQDPPRTLDELKERHQKIRGIVETLETDKDGLSRLLRIFDADFEPIQRLYPYHWRVF